MNNQKLDLILNKLGSIEYEVKSVKSEQNNMNEEIKSIKTEQQSMNKELKSIKDEQHNMKAEVNSIHQKLDDLETKSDHIQSDVSKIKQNVKHLERSVNDDVIAILKAMKNKTNESESNMTVLNNRLFKVESKVQQITEQRKNTSPKL